MRSMIFAAVGGVAMAAGGQAALAFTFEGQGGAQPTTPQANAQQSAPQIGFSGMDPASVLPPISSSIEDNAFNFRPGAYNNGLASPPTRGNSVGPSWLYPPGR